MHGIGKATHPPEIIMDKLPRNRLDNTLNAILIAVGVSAMVTIALDTPHGDPALAAARHPQVVAQAASQPGDSANLLGAKVAALAQGQVAR
jgi:hypothetical protein